MPILRAIIVDGYRCFEANGRLEIRPLTLLYGRNNAGKSSLLRLLPILQRSTADAATSPFDLSGPEGRDSDFRGALWQDGNGRRMELELEWDGDDGLLADRYVITYEDHSRRVWVESYEQRLNGRVEIGLVSRRPLGSGVYGLADGGEIAVEFSGLSPDEPAGRVQLMELAARLKTLRRSIQWLGPARVEPPALIPSSSLQRIDPDGTGAAEILVQDSDILADVQAWYAREPVGRRLRKEQISGDYHRLVLDTEAGPYGVGLNQTGDGMAHVLPVLAASAVARRLGTRGILAVEDPGAHLHDDARRALATHLCEIAATSAPPKFVLETHSRTFLLSVQLAIAKGSLPPDSVAVHWVVQGGDGRSSAQLVEFESNGLPRSSVLSDILSEDRALARELLNMQLPDMP